MIVTLPPELEQYVQQQIEVGVYRDSSEVIQRAVRLLMEQDIERGWSLEDLRREIQIGLDQAERGELKPLDMEAIKAEARRRFEARNR